MDQLKASEVLQKAFVCPKCTCQQFKLTRRAGGPHIRHCTQCDFRWLGQDDRKYLHEKAEQGRPETANPGAVEVD